MEYDFTIWSGIKLIDKLYKLKQTQLNQELLKKQQLNNKLHEIEEKIKNIQHQLVTSGVKMFGSIGDFKVLAIHKNSLKFEKKQLEDKKRSLLHQISLLDDKIIEFQKEVEQFDYILKQNMKKKIKEIEKKEQISANEFIQARWMVS